MFDFSYANILHSNLINFIILVILIIVLAIKLDFAQKIEQLRLSIENKVKDSDSNLKNANKFLEETKKSVANLGEELEQIKNDAEKTVENMAEQIKAETNSQIEKYEQNKQNSIETDISKIQAELQNEISEQCIADAKNLLQNKLANNNDLHKKLIDESITNLDKVQF